ncbi:MAG: efflux RND transporter permease subunit [Nitrospira sp.]|nr:efflux RND transporter permease subunit [bacterium]MBL7048995.1 efflux RND transporter permease subunit [Nitrospira sp.]
MAKNSVAANILMFVLVIGGLIIMSGIKQEVFPEYDLDIVNVSVSYPGASPEEVEEGIILAIEEEIREFEEIERVTSKASEGRASVVVELLAGVDADKVVQDIKNSVDRISSMPDDAERPVISLQKRRREVLRIALYGDVAERPLFYFAQGLREELLDIPSVTQVELRGVREPEISIEVPQALLRAHGLTLEEIAGIIRTSSLDLPAGGIKASGGEILLRTSEGRDFASEFANIPLVSKPDGTVVTVGDIAQIQDKFAESDREAYFNGKRAVLVYVYRTGEQTPIQISADVREFLDYFKTALPEGVNLDIYNDRSELYQDRLNLLMRNGILGLVLVMITLGLFMETRLAFWVSMGIPISIIGSFLILKYIGGSVNMVSLFAFIITLGIVVDDAVVVGENIFHKREQGLSPLDASIAGVREMSTVILFAVLTNIIAFLPLMFVPGSTGKFFAILPAVVVAVFSISLVECLFILPAHLAYHRRKVSGGILATIDRVPQWFEKVLAGFIAKYYRPLVSFAVKNRYLTTIIFMAVLSVVYAYWDSGRIDFSFRPKIQTDRIDAEVTLPFGAPIEDVRRIARIIEEGGLRAIEKSGGKDILEGVMTEIGRRGANTAEVSFFLVPQGERSITTRKFSTLWRSEVGEIAGLESLFFDYLIGPGGSSAINIELTHPDPVTLESAASELAGALSDYDGVTDIDDGYARGKTQFDFSLTSEGRSLGLMPRELGTQVRHAFHGAEALRKQRGRDEVRVKVRLPETERVSLYDLEGLMIRLPQGGEIPLARAAAMKSGRAYTEINRVDGRRVLNVTGNVIQGMANENKVLASVKAEFMPKFISKYPGLKYSFEGRERERRKAFKQLLAGLGFALLGIFTLLAALFRSYVQAIFVMVSILFGLASAVVGHVLMGYELSIISMFGMIALCGIVINGGLVLTVTANRMCDNGSSDEESAINAGARRFRPIILTALTTFIGLAPMIFETSVQARFLIPMAISLGYGILFTTFVILLLTPALYVIQKDLYKMFHK